MSKLVVVINLLFFILIGFVLYLLQINNYSSPDFISNPEFNSDVAEHQILCAVKGLEDCVISFPGDTNDAANLIEVDSAQLDCKREKIDSSTGKKTLTAVPQGEFKSVQVVECRSKDKDGDSEYVFKIMHASN